MAVRLSRPTGMLAMLDWMEDDLNERRRRGLHRARRRLQSAQGAHVLWRGRELVNFSSNDYLALAADPRLARAAASAAGRYGCGAGASPLVSGLLPPTRRLERALAAWEDTEAALVFSSGFAANLAVVSSLGGRDAVLFSDELNHASLIDGCRLSRARTHVYRHADADHLEALLSASRDDGARRIIVTDTVFSMDGDIAPLRALAELAERFDTLLVIDEAHATGVLGAAGRGTSELLGLGNMSPERLVKIGTLSKALGAQGGFVCGRRRLIEWLINHARPYIFSTALAPPSAAAAHRAVRIVVEEPQRRQSLLALAETLRNALRALGLDPGRSCSQIVPILVGAPADAVALSRRLARRGLLVPAIRPPSVPEGTARLRISLTAGHTEDDVTQLVEALRRG
jgi:8-amino-7-oxononanoate synthase